MDAFKGVFRRANQSVKEKTGRAEATHDGPLEEAIKRVRLMERQGNMIMDKVAKLSKAFEEIGALCAGISEDYKQTAAEGFTAPEMMQLAQELAAYGQEVVGKAQELQRGLKENAYDNVGAFVREVPQIKLMEEDRKKKQLEFDFFREKVVNLVKDPPKDSTRIPRNEGIRENWRQQLWQSTEAMKAQVSNMVSNGQRSLDSAVYTVSMTLGNYMGYCLNSAKNHFASARLPAYSTAPLLPPAPLPPPPPPYQPPQQPVAYGQQPPPPGAVGYGQPPGPYGGQPAPYGTPQHQQQPPQFGSPQHQPAPGQGQYQSPGPQQQQQSQPWNNNTSFGQQPAAPPQQPSQVSYGYESSGQPQQQQQQQQPAWSSQPPSGHDSASPWASPQQPQQQPAAAQQPWGSPQQHQQQPQQQAPPPSSAAPWAA